MNLTKLSKVYEEKHALLLTQHNMYEAEIEEEPKETFQLNLFNQINNIEGRESSRSSRRNTN